MISTPILDCQFDVLLRRKLAIDGTFDQPTEFRVGSKSKRYDLTERQVRGLCCQVGGQDFAITKPFFEPDHTILDRQYHQSGCKCEEDQGQTKDCPKRLFPTLGPAVCESR